MNEKKFYVYEHWRNDRQECFYVGKGHGRRAYDMKGERSRWHRFIVKKLESIGCEVDVRIIHSNLSEPDAFEKEIALIADWRSRGVKLVNMTDGGEGASGAVISQETRDLIGKKSRGRRHTAETRAKMAKAALGNKHGLGYKRKPHEIELISARSKGKKASPETREKMRLAKLGRKLSEEHKAKIKASVTVAYQSDEIRMKCFPSAETVEKGRSANLGKKQTKEHIEKKILAALGKKRGPYKTKAGKQLTLLSVNRE